MRPVKMLVAATLATGLLVLAGQALFGGQEAQAATPYSYNGRGYVRLGEILPTTYAWWGDSLTQGACNPTPPPAALLPLLGPGWWASNLGVSGETTAQITTRYASGEAAACLGERCGTVIIAGGTNDCGGGACDPAAVLATQLAAVDDALQKGRRVVLVDIPPFRKPEPCPGCLGGTLAGVEKALEYNALLQEACVSPTRPYRHRLRCVSTYPAMEASWSSTSERGYLAPGLACGGGDYVHTSQDGADVLAQLVYEAIASF